MRPRRAAGTAVVRRPDGRADNVTPLPSRGDGRTRDSEAFVRLSTRNQLPGTVESVQVGEAMTVVKVNLDGGQTMTAAITRDAADELGLASGSKVTVLVKSTEVMLATE
jgi:molybdate transport system regulatory protein